MQDMREKNVPIFVMLPASLGPIFCDENKMSWQLHRFLKAWVQPKDREVKQFSPSILEWMIWSCVKGGIEETNATETDMSVVTLLYRRLESWQKLWIEGTTGKYPETQRVSAPQINKGSSVAAAASMSVSQAKIFFVRSANTAININGAIARDSETGEKKFMARQWSALIEFCGVETQKQVQNIWKQIEKSRGARKVRTIVVTSIKEQHVDVDRHSNRVCFGENVAEDIWKCRFTYKPVANMVKT